MKVDFHVHTKYSPDSNAEVSEILQFAKRRGLDAIAITDHDNLQGNREARRIRTSRDVEIIPGVELTLPAGKWGLHVIALNIDEYISFRNVEEAILKLRKTKAILILPHPFRRGTGFFEHVRNQTITKKEQKIILKNIDYLEILNMKDVRGSISKTFALSRKYNLPIVAGTDAHYPEFIGMAHTEVSSLRDLLNKKCDRNLISVYCKSMPGTMRELVDLLETANDFRYRWGNTYFARVLARVLYKLRLNRDHKDRRLRSEAINLIFNNSANIKFKKTSKGLEIAE